MIINDSKRVAFIHVPKCAGTAIRRRVALYDESGTGLSGYVAEHPDLGLIDYTHIPLFILRQSFPDAYAKIAAYSSFCLVRDPWERFPSSLTQHLRMYGPAPIHELKAGEVRKEVDAAINALVEYFDSGSYLPANLIHFQRQVDFVFDQERQVVQNIYDASDVRHLWKDMAHDLGVENPGSVVNKDSVSANRGVVYRNPLARVVYQIARASLKPLLPMKLRRGVVRSTAGIVFVRRDRKLGDIWRSSEVTDFVQRYYSRDIALHARIANAAISGGSSADYGSAGRQRQTLIDKNGRP